MPHSCTPFKIQNLSLNRSSNRIFVLSVGFGVIPSPSPPRTYHSTVPQTSQGLRNMTVSASQSVPPTVCIGCCLRISLVDNLFRRRIFRSSLTGCHSQNVCTSSQLPNFHRSAIDWLHRDNFSFRRSHSLPSVFRACLFFKKCETSDVSGT